ncbi:cyclin-domain-containing protein [Patellaria atrata CBS 101060]|uniref:Cyclin-domain-containing protein n=1 Tax=Patellaria atrata CBS 101060 TaxID=1346257 RepID=A0A9P4SEI4_9PEZI|nr:cyclin-domain-containing protein [Patellaria atrata CBS 101060]
MLTSSPSPTFSPSSSPSGHFQARGYSNASSYRRPSSQSSPRFPTPQPPQTSAATSTQHCRLDASTTPTSHPLNSSSLSHSSQTSLNSNLQNSLPRTTADAGTQYTPPDFPPTYRRPNPTTDAPSLPDALAVDISSTNKSQGKRRESSASSSTIDTESDTTEIPVEPDLRVEPPRPLPSPIDSIKMSIGSSSKSVSSEPSNQSGSGPSGSKRARVDSTIKILPYRYEDCDVKDLGSLVADLLLELIKYNDDPLLKLRDAQLTRFHSRAPPGISVREYLMRIIIHAGLPTPIVLCMVYYIDTLCSHYPAFTISSLTVHRFLITAATVASKGLSDSFWTNPFYARVGGVSARELALLELEFLIRVDWTIVPQAETLRDYYTNLVNRCDGYEIARRPT